MVGANLTRAATWERSQRSDVTFAASMIALTENVSHDTRYHFATCARRRVAFLQCAQVRTISDQIARSRGT
jgi:hypothetical protein